jgi:hypothetical protein
MDFIHRFPRLFFWLITLSILLMLFALFHWVRVPYSGFGDDPKYVMIEGSYRIFNLKEHLQQYDSVKIEIKSQQFRLAQYYKNADEKTKKKIIQEAQSYIALTLNNELIPFWIDTEWDFNGTTETPRQGAIACGFFVSTVLMHAGFQLNKSHLSTGTASVMIRSLCNPSSIKTIPNKKFENFMAYLQTQNDGVYIVGLDKHVGLITKHQHQIYFIHSRKPRTAGVIKELASESPSLKSSSGFVIGNLLENESLVIAWLSS